MPSTYTTLIETETLEPLVGRDDVVIIDCRHTLADPTLGERQYREGHIPGAHFLHLDRDLSGATTGKNGRHPLPDPDQLAGRLGQIGIGPGVQVVAYDQGNCMVSGRVWWLLNWLGHAQVAVLNGGFARWTAEGRSVTESLPAKPTARKLTPRLSMKTVDAAHVQADLQRPEVLTIIDARAADRFRGENNSLDAVAGHIPGALNRPYTENLGGDGRFKPAAELRAEFLRLLGGREPATVVHQCGSGVTACHNILAMKLAGIEGASTLYPGSWSEWCSDPSRPVET